MTKRDLLTLAEAAQRLGVAAGTLGNQARHGKLKATKRGRDWMVSEAETERYGREQRRGPATVRNAIHELEEAAANAHAELVYDTTPMVSFGVPRPAPKPGRRG